MPATGFTRVEGAPGAVGAFFRHRHAVLFYSLLLTLGAAPLASALGGGTFFLQAFLALNLLGAAASIDRYRRALVVLALASIAGRFLAASTSAS